MFTFRGLPYVPLLAACLCAGLAVSCNGTGGAAHAGGELYTGGGTGSSGPDGSSTGSYSLLDVTSLANMRDVETLLAIFSAGAGEEEASNTIVLNADELGLPDGGFVTLTMSWSGGSYTRTVQKNADGTVTFNGIPFIADDTQVTVDLAVKNANHEEVWAGIGTNEVKNGSCNIHVELERYLPLSELGAYIAALPTNSPTTPHRLPPISGLNAGNLGTLTGILQAIGDYSIGTGWTPVGTFVDLSATTLPSGITSLAGAFSDCYTLVKAPVLPAGVEDLSNCFARCRSLSNAPAIPAGVKNMESCFICCDVLTTAPVIPASVTDMSNCFQSSFSTGPGLSNSLVIKANITDPAKIANVFSSAYYLGSVNVYFVSEESKSVFLSDSSNSTLIDASRCHVGPPWP